MPDATQSVEASAFRSRSLATGVQITSSTVRAPVASMTSRSKPSADAASRRA